jgi:hypothetical protein
MQIPSLEVWFQRASDVVRKLRYGDIDLGIVGADMWVCDMMPKASIACFLLCCAHPTFSNVSAHCQWSKLGFFGMVWLGA